MPCVTRTSSQWLLEDKMNIFGFDIPKTQLLIGYLFSLMWMVDAGFMFHLGWAAVGIFGK